MRALVETGFSIARDVSEYIVCCLHSSKMASKYGDEYKRFLATVYRTRLVPLMPVMCILEESTHAVGGEWKIMVQLPESLLAPNARFLRVHISRRSFLSRSCSMCGHKHQCINVFVTFFDVGLPCISPWSSTSSLEGRKVCCRQRAALQSSASHSVSVQVQHQQIGRVACVFIHSANIYQSWEHVYPRH